MPQPNDGTFQCTKCKTALNEDDKVCWRCGCSELTDMRVQPEVTEPTLTIDDTASRLRALREATTTTNTSPPSMWFPPIITGTGNAVPPAPATPTATSGSTEWVRF